MQGIISRKTGHKGRAGEVIKEEPKRDHIPTHIQTNLGSIEPMDGDIWLLGSYMPFVPCSYSVALRVAHTR